MKLVCDQGVERPIVEHLRQHGHHVDYIAESDPGAEDDVVLVRAHDLKAPLVTNDKDFGELVFRQGLAMSGVILLRLSGTSSRAKALAVIKALQEHHDQLHGAFTVISPGRVRIRRRLPPARVERPL